MTDGYLVNGHYNGAFASSKDSGSPVFKEDGTLIGLIVAGASGAESALVIDIRPFLSSASLTLVCERLTASSGG
ncbi:MAG: hypothetical protein WDN76_08125 [Alphaproteobacteria bacterium]